MEARLGADFSTVRVHTGPVAGRSAAAIGAQAYSCGEHVVLRPGADDRYTRKPDKNFVITPNGRLDGSPQVTIGLALDADHPDGPVPAARLRGRGRAAADHGGRTAIGASTAAGQTPTCGDGARCGVSLRAGRRVTGRGAVPTLSDDLRGLIA